MIPTVLTQIALIIIIIRSVYRAFKHFDSARKAWLDLLFHLSVAIVALALLKL